MRDKLYGFLSLAAGAAIKIIISTEGDLHIRSHSFKTRHSEKNNDNVKSCFKIKIKISAFFSNSGIPQLRVSLKINVT